MKTILPILLILLLAACGGSEGAETPELAVERFIEALQSGDPDDIYDSLLRSEGEIFKKTDDRRSENRWEDCDIEDFEIKGKELDGNRYKVTVLITREVNDAEVQSEESVICIEEHKRWKVSMSSSSTVFIPSGKREE